MGIDDRKLDIEEQRKQVELDLAAISRQIDEMDSKIRAYLADKKTRPHPRHLELIDKVQGYRIPNSLLNKHLSVLLDNLQWKLHYNKRAWQQLWEQAEKQGARLVAPPGEFRPDGSAADERSTPMETKAQYSLETLWEIQQEKLRVYGFTDTAETKADFKKRMIQEYKALNQDRKPSQEIIMTFDKDSGKCRLDVK